MDMHLDLLLSQAEQSNRQFDFGYMYMYLTMTIQMLGQLERKNRVLLISQSQLLQHSVSFVWQHHFRIDVFYISRVSDLAGILFIIKTIKI